MILLLFLASVAVIYWIVPAELMSEPAPRQLEPEPAAQAAAAASAGLAALGLALERAGKGATPSAVPGTAAQPERMRAER